MRLFGISIRKCSTVDEIDHKHYKVLGLQIQNLAMCEQRCSQLVKVIDIIEAFVVDRDKATAEVSLMLSRDFTLTQIEKALVDQPHLKAQVEAVMKRVSKTG